MTISSAFRTYTLTTSKILNTAILTFTLIGIEAILDSNFQCPTKEYNAVLTGFYSLSFFLCPAIVFIYIGMYYFPGFNNKRQSCPCWSGSWACIYVVLQVGKAPLMWILIAMTDGRYLSCFVVAASNYELDPHLYLFIFQTSGILSITLVVMVWYYISTCSCSCLEESRRTYQMLADVESILVEDETQKEKNKEKHKFLCALEHDGVYMDRQLPKYMREKEDVITAKLTSPTDEHNGKANGKQHEEH